MMSPVPVGENVSANMFCKQLWSLLRRLVHGNVIPVGIPWETSHWMGQA